MPLTRNGYRSNSYFSEEYLKLDKKISELKQKVNKLSRGCKEFDVEINGHKYRIIALNKKNAIRKAKILDKENATVQTFRID